MVVSKAKIWKLKNTGCLPEVGSCQTKYNHPLSRTHNIILLFFKGGINFFIGGKLWTCNILLNLHGVPGVTHFH